MTEEEAFSRLEADELIRYAGVEKYIPTVTVMTLCRVIVARGYEQAISFDRLMEVLVRVDMTPFRKAAMNANLNRRYPELFRDWTNRDPAKATRYEKESRAEPLKTLDPEIYNTLQ